MRLFAALELPEPVRRGLYEWWSDAREELDPEAWRYLSAHQWHLTLAFYGDVAGDDIDDLAEGLQACAAESPPLDLRSSGCGAFPKPGRANVFWVGVEDHAEPSPLRHLARCCRRVGHATVRGRSARETPFRGHITLARARGRTAPLESRGPALNMVIPELQWRAEQLCLYESVLRPDGAKYRRLETFELGRQRREGYYVR